MVAHDEFADYHRTNFLMMVDHGLNSAEIDDMLPFERDLFIMMLTKHMEKKAAAAAQK